MFIDCLGDSTLEEIYQGLVNMYGVFPFSKQHIEQKLKNYCTARHIPLTEAVIPQIVGKQLIKVSNEQFQVVKHILTGVFQPEFEGNRIGVFGNHAVLQKLQSSRGKKITVLILEE